MLTVIKTIVAESGEKGLLLASQNKPALILMDIRLPGINGFETMRRIRLDPTLETIPIIAITASVMPQEREKLLAAGFTAFLANLSFSGSN